MQRILKAIQERKVDRVAVAYAVAAWILVQAASIGLPTFGAPVWTMKVIILAALAGFPLALWITWYVAAPAHGMADEASVSLRRTDMALLGVLAILVVLVGAEFAYQLGAFRDRAAARVASSVMPAYRLQAQAGPPPNSVAVLPFLNLSGDPKKEFFSDGVSEELLNDLANAPNLRVAARTSCFAFKGKAEDIRKIGRALNVRAILEGSVREDGQHIRITAQLINASDGFHLWSKTYDRDLSNILQVQDDIAQAITGALTHTLGGGPARPRQNRPAIDPDAYREYLKAQALSALKTDEGDAQAVALLKTVTAREPNFAPAFAALGRTYVHMAEFHNQRADLLESATAVLKTALQLDPRNLDALSTDLHVATVERNWDHAEKDAALLRSINPHNVFTLRGLAHYYGTLAFPQQQTAALREAIELDPLSFVDLNNLASVLNERGQYIEAAAAASDALSVKPNRPLSLYSLCWAYAARKNLPRAQALSERLRGSQNVDAADACALRAATAAGNFHEARRLADAVAGRFPSFIFSETDIGYFYTLAGDFATAMPWFNRAYDRRDSVLFSLAYVPTTPPALLRTSGWLSLIARPDARAWQAAHDRLAGDLSGN